MEASFLVPPNNYSLSDGVIGSVMQRHEKGWKARYSYQPGTDMTYLKAVKMPNSLKQVGPDQRSTYPSTYSLDPSLTSTQEVTRQHSTLGIPRRRRKARSELERKLIHRERCRVNQARYRQRQLKIISDLEEDIGRLRIEIESLELSAKNPPTVPTRPTIWTVAAEYFRHFRFFISSPGLMHSAAMNFLREIMAFDVHEGPRSGIEAHLDNWRFFSVSFEDIQLELKGLNTLTASAQEAVTITRVTISEATLRLVFPNLNSDGKGGADGGEWSPLAARLLGQRLVMHGSVRFDWDDMHDRLMGIESRSDMLTPLLRLLGNLPDVSIVFDNALVSPECRFVG